MSRRLEERLEEAYDKEDIKFLNLFNCDSSSVALDFFEYGGITRGIYRLSPSRADLESLIKGKPESRHMVNVSASELEETDGKHMIFYDLKDSVASVMVNSYNSFSKDQDFKCLAKTKIKDKTGKEYDACFVSTEIYRSKDAASKKAIWGMGFYVTNKQDQDNILYAEEAILDLEDTASRAHAQSIVCIFMNRLSHLQYNSNLNGFNRDKNTFECIPSASFDERLMRFIDLDEFKEKRSKWFRYSSGNMDVRNILKFEDRYGYNKGVRVYRVELINSHFNSKGEQKYYIEILSDTDGDPDQPNGRLRKLGSYTHNEAIKCFLTAGNYFIDQLCINSEKKEMNQFEIAPDTAHIDFRYATIVKDKKGSPLTITSWESPYGIDGRMLGYHSSKKKIRKMHHYVQIWNSNPEPLRLEEGIDFPEGMHPKKFMKELIYTIPQITYSKDNFVSTVKEKGIPLI